MIQVISDSVATGSVSSIIDTGYPAFAIGIILAFVGMIIAFLIDAKCHRDEAKRREAETIAIKESNKLKERDLDQNQKLANQSSELKNHTLDLTKEIAAQEHSDRLAEVHYKTDLLSVRKTELYLKHVYPRQKNLMDHLAKIVEYAMRDGTPKVFTDPIKDEPPFEFCHGYATPFLDAILKGAGIDPHIKSGMSQEELKERYQVGHTTLQQQLKSLRNQFVQDMPEMLQQYDEFIKKLDDSITMECEIRFNKITQSKSGPGYMNTLKVIEVMRDAMEEYAALKSNMSQIIGECSGGMYKRK